MGSGNLKAMVFAAGLGTRLRPLTDTMPKALVPVQGEPMLSRVLRKIAAAGYSEAIVNVHHFASQVVDYLSGRDFGMTIRISDESSLLLDTGGGLLAARRFLEDCTEPFLVHNVDIFSNLDLKATRRSLNAGAAATLVVSGRKTSGRYLLFDEQMRLAGWTDTRTGEVRSPYPGLNPAEYRKFAFSGIHFVSPSAFGALEDYSKERGSAVFPIMDFYLSACASLPVFGLAPDGLEVTDAGKIGTISSLTI